MESNHSLNETFDPYPRDEDLAEIEVATLICIFLVSIIGNSLVLLALHAKKCQRGRKPLPRMYFFIFHLCIADLINALFNTLPQLLWDITYRFKGGQVLCKVVKYGQILGPYLSSYILMVTALDRYRAICYPLTYNIWSCNKSRVFVAYAWFVSSVFSVPQTMPAAVWSAKRLDVAYEMFIFSYQEVAPGIWDCWATFHLPWGERTYVVWYSVSIFIVPLSVLIFTYTLICQVIWTNGPTELGKQRQMISRAKINTVKQTIAVIAAYIVCSLPFIVAELWAVWDPSAYDAVWSGPLFTILVLLSSLNSCANPWIFMTFNSDLFVSLKMFLLGKISSKNICRKNSTGDCLYVAKDAQKKSSRKRCFNLGKLFSQRNKSKNFGVRRWTTSAEENGTNVSPETSTINFSREST